MIRRTLRFAAAALIAAFAFAGVAQAAPPSKRIRHRVKQARGATVRTATPRPVVKKKKAPAKRKAAARTAARRPAARKNPSTKPR